MRRDSFGRDIGRDDLRFGSFEHWYELCLGSVPPVLLLDSLATFDLLLH